jgi:hypothetical protein
VAVAVSVRVAREDVGRDVLCEAPLRGSIVQREINCREIASVLATTRSNHHRDDIAREHADIFEVSNVDQLRALA